MRPSADCKFDCDCTDLLEAGRCIPCGGDGLVLPGMLASLFVYGLVGCASFAGAEARAKALSALHVCWRLGIPSCSLQLKWKDTS